MPLDFASSRASGVTTARLGIKTSVVPVGIDSSVAAVISFAEIECGAETTGPAKAFVDVPGDRGATGADASIANNRRITSRTIRSMKASVFELAGG